MGTERYRPSNGTEGEAFYGVWCARCAGEAEHRETGEAGCPIYIATLALDIGDPEYPADWVAIDGVARCLSFRIDGDAPERLDPNAAIGLLL